MLSNKRLAVAVLLLGALYVGKAWTPSSYGLALSLMGEPRAGLSFGTPRPIRSDEWAVYTPLNQIAVNNHFQRFNQTSPYGEDLRTFHVLPLHDWGFLFKPALWLFLIADPAYAFSFNHFVLIILFLLGHMLLLERMGLKRGHALAISAILFFTAFTQHWWTTYGPLLAYFPWVCLAPIARLPLPLRALLSYWVTASWLINHFYPPLFLPLSFVGICLILGYRWLERDWRVYTILGLAGVAGACTALYYLSDYLLATLPTLYPGQRRLEGGGVTWQFYAEQLFPYAFMRGHDGLMPPNVCEASVVGSQYLLAVLCFLDYQKATRAFAKRLLPLLVPLVLMLAWEVLPLPAWVGIPLLWNFVPSHRMLYASGLVCLFLCAYAASELGLKPGKTRIAIYMVCLASGWLFVAWPQQPHTLQRVWPEAIATVPALLAGLCLARPQIFTQCFHCGVLGINVVYAALTFGTFNPLQSARPIFHRDETAVLKSLTTRQAEQGGTLAVEGYPGAILNGWGFKSLSHLLPVPHVDFFAKRYPELTAEQLNQAFNRYAHIIPDSSILEPVNRTADSVNVPIPSACNQTRNANHFSPGSGLSPDLAVGTLDGAIDSVQLSNGILTVAGWADGERGLSGPASLELIADVPLAEEKMDAITRFDVAEALHAPGRVCDGFRFQAKASEEPHSLCVLGENSLSKHYGIISRSPGELAKCIEILKRAR